MQEPTLLLLPAPAKAPRHGCAVAQEVRAVTGGRVVPRTGALYGALDRLLEEGLLGVAAGEVVGGRARRTFALTDSGRERPAAEADRMAAIAREVRRRLGPGGMAVPT